MEALDLMTIRPITAGPFTPLALLASLMLEPLRGNGLQEVVARAAEGKTEVGAR
jgi:hypothetical protein